MHRKMRLLSPLLALMFIILFAGLANVHAQVEFKITSLTCSPTDILPGDKVTITVKIEGIPNKSNNNIGVSVTTPTGLKSTTTLKIATGEDGTGSGSVIYPDNFLPEEQASTTELGEYTVEAKYRTAKFKTSIFVINESLIGTAFPLVAGFAAIAVIGIMRKKKQSSTPKPCITTQAN